MTAPVWQECEAPAAIDQVLADEAERRSDTAARTCRTDDERSLGLDMAHANGLAAARRLSVIVLAGGAGCGKTSVYTAIYELLGRGPCGRWMFAGSQSVPAFERRGHEWRTHAETGGRGTDRTGPSDPPWLHLRLRHSEAECGRLELLLGDVDGEVFEQVLDGRLAAKALSYLRRADHVGLVVDGGRIADPTTRVAERQRTRYLLDALTVPGVLAHPSALSLVVTKADLIPRFGADEVASCLEGIADIASEVTGEVVPLLHLAARSETSDIPPGYGLDSLLSMIAARPTQKIGGRAPEAERTPGLGRFEA